MYFAEDLQASLYKCCRASEGQSVLQGIPRLKEELKKVTLAQKYMGEKIPEVWLNLEKQLLR